MSEEAIPSSEPQIGCTMSTDSVDSERFSIMYTMLPPIFQSRIPKLPSIRQAVRRLHRSPSDASSNGDSIGTRTPPPRYTSKPASARGKRWSMISDTDDETDFDRPSSSGTTPPMFLVSEDQSGINWKYANQGLSLLIEAYNESASLSRHHENGQPPFSRQLYTHGLTYLLRGLPSNMTTEEKLSIRFALPTGVAEAPALDPTTGALVPIYMTPAAQPQPQTPQPEPSFLHRFLASTIVQLFVLVHFILPYIKLVLGHVYRYEREHHISERVFSTSINAVDGVGKRSLALSEAVFAMHDGKVGQMINDAAVWWVRSLTGGIHEGMSEGFVIIRAKGSETAQARRRKA